VTVIFQTRTRDRWTVQCTTLLLGGKAASEQHGSDYKTRSCATADGPRDAMCQSKLCQLLQHNSVETSCTTNPEQIEVMELEGYSRQMCNKLCACSHDAVDRRKCNSQARPSTNLLITSSTCRSETVTSPQFAAKFQREVPLFWTCPNFLITQFRISKEAAMPKNTALSI